MTVGRDQLPINVPPPPTTLVFRWPTCLLLGLGAVIVLSTVLGIAFLWGGPLAPNLLFKGALCVWFVYFCVPVSAVAMLPGRNTQYAPGRVSYVRRPGRMTICAPLRVQIVAMGYASLGFVSMGACSVLTLWWALNERVFWESNGIGMAAISLLLPIGIGLLRWTASIATTRGITLTPTHLEARAEGQRLRKAPWEALGLVTVCEFEASKLFPAYTSLGMTTDLDNPLIVSSSILGSDPDSVRCVIEFFRQHPEHRKALEDPRAALALVRNAMLSGWRGAEAAA